MKVNCVYRHYTDGVIIESKFDTETGTIDGVPEREFKIEPDVVKFYPRNYDIYGAVPYPVLHRYLNKYRKAYAVIDYNGIGVMEVQKEVVCTWLFIKEYLPEIKIQPVFTGNVLCLGYAKTVIKQYGVVTKPQMLYYDFVDKCVHTVDGDFPVNFDVNDVQPIKTFNRYIEMVNEPRAIGLALIDGANRLLVNNNGVIGKE